MSDHGLEAILLDADQEDWSDKTIAANVLAECCVENGRYNNFGVGVLAVINYLSARYGKPTIDQQQSFRDLHSILNSGGSVDSIMRWMNTQYP